MATLRLFLSIPVGLVLMGAVVWLAELLTHAVFPPSQELLDAMKRLQADPTAGEARAAVTAAFASMPAGSFLGLIVGWVAGAAAGAWIASRMSGILKRPVAVAIGVLSTVAVGSQLYFIPHPSWMIVPSLALPLLASILIAWSAAKAPPKTTR